jgi:hypothetical protein
MPFLMLAKCAEAQAIRKGWPENLSNTFVGEEIDHAALTLKPAEAAAEGATRERLERIGGHGALIIDWLDAAPLDAVPLGQLRLEVRSAFLAGAGFLSSMASVSTGVSDSRPKPLGLRLRIARRQLLGWASG